ncbi:Exosome complex component rrp4 [Auxenochlorella protothecoides]|uniref:Exosome complex component rrp4 n=1 Tax=Auxenochlorella protothecoides TaxID=3075 RepID=A0A087SNK9_AUXPR|nr:Exosome complex component rrp4 [Auxenochlorella protothecoides]KFM27313.1 Exosome complex component rrp4 [Auxenochlorella protothecoides]
MSAIRVQRLDVAAPRTILEAGLAEAPSNLDSTRIVSIGDELDMGTDQESILRGHGTQTRAETGALVASVAGVVERVDQLVTVKTLRTRYVAEVGDVVVGRVAEIVGKRWRLDLGSRHEATLLLSAVDLPGGIQRRRTAEDELTMRAVFPEGTVLAVEVQSVHADGGLALHARSARYGALAGGTLVAVPGALVRRQARHFQRLDGRGVDLILGCNGGERQGVARVAQALRALATLYLPIDAGSVAGALQVADAVGVATPDMGSRAYLTALVEDVAAGRVATAADRGQ